jgi:hypothetical protein
VELELLELEDDDEISGLEERLLVGAMALLLVLMAVSPWKVRRWDARRREVRGRWL